MQGRPTARIAGMPGAGRVCMWGGARVQGRMAEGGAGGKVGPPP